jgi:prevent-host-death family protein
MQTWQLQEAKAQLSELVKSCQRDGPQEISVRGEAAAVVLSRRDYERLRQARRPGLVEFLRRSPLRGVELDVERSRSTTRDVRL